MAGSFNPEMQVQRDQYQRRKSEGYHSEHGFLKYGDGDGDNAAFHNIAGRRSNVCSHGSTYLITHMATVPTTR